MAVTVLKNLKESKIKGDPANHLRRAIYYILNPKKTRDGLLSFSNCGTSPESIFDAMIVTKKDYQKEWGRQGYHFVISFQPGECDEDTAMKVGRDFCEKYLGDAYDYCFSVHNDHPHMHIHIVFNSVSRYTGLKYRYVNGDWEKSIQPITDMICEKYGLSKLEYEKSDKRIGKSYAEHIASKKNAFTWSKIIRADIDHAITISENLDDYFQIMKGYGYQLRIGQSEKHGKYVAYSHPGVSERESKKAHRDYSLGKDYTLARVEDRIWLREKKQKTYIIPSMSEIPYLPKPKKNRFQVCLYNRVQQAYAFQFLDLRIESQIRARKDLLHINQVAEEAEYIIKNDMSDFESCEKRLSEVKAEIKQMKDTGFADSEMELTADEVADRKRYEEIRSILAKKEDQLSDEDFERLSDELEDLEEKYKEDPLILSNQQKNSKYETLNEERKILLRILREKPIINSVEDVRTTKSKDESKQFSEAPINNSLEDTPDHKESRRL